MKKSELIQELREARRGFLDSVDGLSEKEASRADSIGAWSIKDVVAHMVYWDREFFHGMKTLLSGGFPDFLEFDCDEKNAAEVSKRKNETLEELVKDLNESGRSILDYLGGLEEDELRESWGQKWKTWDVTVAWIAEGIIGHDRHHTGKILAWRRKYKAETK